MPIVAALSFAPPCAAEQPAWVAASNAHAKVLIEPMAAFSPELASSLGLSEFDERVVDLGPRLTERRRTALEQAKAELERRLAAEREPLVRQDLELMIDSATRQIDGVVMEDRYVLPWVEAPRLVFGGTQRVLDKQFPRERHLKALVRLRRYAGLEPGSTPVATLARARYEEKAGNDALLAPMKAEVEQALANTSTYVKGLRESFAAVKVEGAEPALAALEKQFAEYDAWVRETVLPRARTGGKLPRDYYAYRLRQVGIDIEPEALIERAQLEFMETRAAMAALAPLVAKAHGIDATDYREVMRALKAKQLGAAEVEAYYRTVIDAIDEIIVRERIVDVPKRAMIMRLGTPAESAAQPAPHFRAAPLVGNTGEQGQFVLPLGNPQDGKSETYDDFTYKAAAWTLSAHEGRPGHELQFTSLLERGVSLARAALSRNSVNTEGWALYAEAEMVPYEPIEGQLIALQFRLMRAARAIIDPSLNLGLMTRERGRLILVDDVVLSEAMARQELDRYEFRSPGQAGAYFYGYTRILQLRMETEIALGEKFDRFAYNNFLLDQGTLPPDLLAKAVREQFVPRMRAR
ncbi:MAG TPA: DUF885 domain-containing protein [Candidatus Saccharimonadia bacterium]|nr:DUF885 domain-containing protein [Candidatus Saccharimonadia bacterium]